jgi:hypothetical protein
VDRRNGCRRRAGPDGYLRRSSRAEFAGSVRGCRDEGGRRARERLSPGDRLWHRQTAT